MEQRAKVIKQLWRRALERIEAAEREYGAGVYYLAVSHLYYSLFYSVSAVLLEMKKSFTRHKGVKIAFHKELIHPGLLEKKWGELYDQLFEDRNEGDYVVLSSLEHPVDLIDLDGGTPFARVLEEKGTLHRVA